MNFWVCVWFLKKHKKMEEKFSVLSKKNEKKKVWLCGLKVKSKLNFDVLKLCGGFDFLDLFIFNSVFMWI